MYYQIIRDGYFILCGKMAGEFQGLSETEYTELQEILASKPVPQEDGYDYRLTKNWEWEMYKLPKEDKEIPDEEAFNIIMGSAT